MKHSFRMWCLSVMSIIALLALAAATYAWFSSNRKVSTSTATARTGDETLELQISSSGGGSFKDNERVSIAQVNQTNAKKLLPVSTSDLSNFVYSPVPMDRTASAFKSVENEDYYYHGRVYLRAVGDGWSSGSKMDLYLDETDGVFGSASSGNLLTATRLGLTFDGKSPVILKLSDSSSPKANQVYNTVVGGVTLGANQVLHSSGGSKVKAVHDPSKLASDYTIGFSRGSLQIPKEPLISMDFNKIYAVDIYFYLEGCDPDCSDSISFDESDLYLGFYGVLNEGANR